MRAVPLPSSSSAPATSAPPAAGTTTVGTLKEKALGLIDFFTRVYTTADGAGFLQLGAAIAFHILLAVGPLVVVILAAAGIFLGDDAAQGRLFGELAGLTGESGASFIEEVVKRSAGKGTGIAAAVGFFMFLWTASGVFDQVRMALANIDRVSRGELAIVMPPKEEPWYRKLADTGWAFVRARISAILMIVVIVALLIASLIASSVISVMTSVFDPWLDTRWLVIAANFVMSFSIFTVLSAALYRLLSSPRVGRVSALIGGLGAAVMFLVGRSVIGLVVPLTASESAFGPAASVITILYWGWFSAVTLLMGFALAVTDARDRGARDAKRKARPS